MRSIRHRWIVKDHFVLFEIVTNHQNELLGVVFFPANHTGIAPFEIIQNLRPKLFDLRLCRNIGPHLPGFKTHTFCGVVNFTGKAAASKLRINSRSLKHSVLIWFYSQTSQSHCKTSFSTEVRSLFNERNIFDQDD